MTSSTWTALLCFVAFVVNVLPGVDAKVAVSCAAFKDSATALNIDLSTTAVEKPTFVAVDSGQWVYFASSSAPQVLRVPVGGGAAEVVGSKTNFGAVTGICLSPFDQALYVVDNLNNSLFEIPCYERSDPVGSLGTYCKKYGDAAVQYEVELDNPAQCAVDKAANIYVTQEQNLVMINSTAFSNDIIPVSGSFDLGPITMDLTDFDIYAGDNAQGKIFRLACNQMDGAKTQCLNLDTTPVNPSTSPVTMSRVGGLALNRGEGQGDFELIASDSSTGEVVAISHPKSAGKSSGSVVASLTSADPADGIAMDRVAFDLILTRPKPSSPNAGSLSQIACATEVYAPAPAPSTTTTTTTVQGEMSGGSVFLFILFIVSLVYFGFGCIFLRIIRGIWTIPNLAMWRSLAGLVSDGFRFAFCCKRPDGRTKTVTYNADSSYGTEDSGTGPQYDNIDTMHDDL